MLADQELAESVRTALAGAKTLREVNMFGGIGFMLNGNLAVYRKDIIIPFGFLSMLTQAIIFAWIYEKAFTWRGGTLLSRSLAYAALGAVLSWSFTTLAVAAKNVMTSIPNYLVIETAFTVVQWAMVGPLTAFVFRRAERTVPVTARS